MFEVHVVVFLNMFSLASHLLGFKITVNVSAGNSQPVTAEKKSPRFTTHHPRSYIPGLVNIEKTTENGQNGPVEIVDLPSHKIE